MKMKKIITVAMAVTVVAVFSAIQVFTADETAKKEVFKYVGSKQCIMCHATIDDSAKIWEAGAHAKALEALSSEAAKKINENAAKDPKCLKCHVTGIGEEGGWAADLEEKKLAGVVNVTCEACHGPGGKYSVQMMMAKGNGKPLDMKEAAEKGLIIPTEEVCKKCHNAESPSFKEFDFKKMAEKIKHGQPLEAEKAAE